MTIESDNAKEEIKEIVEKCFKCGLCKPLCPVFKIMREEQFSPRGRAMVLDKAYIDKIVYDCTLCGVCEEKCPLDLKLCEAFIKARKVLVEQSLFGLATWIREDLGCHTHPFQSPPL